VQRVLPAPPQPSQGSLVLAGTTKGATGQAGNCLVLVLAPTSLLWVVRVWAVTRLPALALVVPVLAQVPVQLLVTGPELSAGEVLVLVPSLVVGVGALGSGLDSAAGSGTRGRCPSRPPLSTPLPTPKWLYLLTWPPRWSLCEPHWMDETAVASQPWPPLPHLAM
jgi:hypothetical protein